MIDWMHVIMWVSTGTVTTIFYKKAFTLLVPVKKGWLNNAALLIAMWLLTNMIIFVGDLMNLPPTILVFFLTVYFCCEGYAVQRMAVAMMFASTAFSVNALIDNYITDFFQHISPIPFRLLFYTVFYLWLKEHAPEKDYELSPVLWKLLLSLTVTPLGIVLALILLQDISTRDSDAHISNMVLLVLSCLSFIGLLRTVSVLAKQTKMEKQQQLYEVNRSYYENLEQQQFEIRRLRHDMANHMQALLSLPDDQKEEYIEELIKLPVMQGNMRYCENEVVNAVITAKMGWIEREGIRLKADIAIPESVSVSKIDLCALFADSLDNAIEACRKLKPEEKHIDLEAKTKKGLLVCRMVNPLPEPDRVRENQGLPETSKKDKTRHGLGLRSIQDIVIRYGGRLEIKQSEGLFSLFFYIPFDCTS